MWQINLFVFVTQKFVNATRRGWEFYKILDNAMSNIRKISKWQIGKKVLK